VVYQHIPAWVQHVLVCSRGNNTVFRIWRDSCSFRIQPGPVVITGKKKALTATPVLTQAALVPLRDNNADNRYLPVYGVPVIPVQH